MPAALPANILTALLKALRTHRNARRAAELVGVHQTTAWRIAKKHGIALISLAEHMKARRARPAFIAKQAPAARKGASRWLKAQHAKPKFHKKAIEAARKNLTRLNGDPAFRQASSERLKRLHDDPDFRAKQVAAVRAARNRGFAIAPILYLLGLIGVGAGVLFSGYSQILRSNQTMSNTLAVKNDMQGTATTLAASSWLSTDQTLLCPPMVGSNYPSTPSTKCSTASGAITVGTSFAGATAANLPANYASVSTTGSPVEVGVFKAGSGAKVLDPWGHYYIYCRWENSIGTANALMVISAGANGKVETKCGDTAAGGDDLFVVWTTAVTQNRAAVWQTTTSGTAVTGAQFGATGTQLYVDTSGDLTVPGSLSVTGTGSTAIGTGGLTVTGATALDGGVSATSGAFSGGISATTGSFSSTLGVSGLTTLNSLSAGTSTLSALTVTGNTAVGGTLGVTGITTLGSLTAGTSTLSGISDSGNLSVTGNSFFGATASTGNTAINIGTAYATTGSSVPLLSVGKPTGTPATYPFSVDQFGAVTGSTFTGNLSGNQSGGSVSATTLAASGAATLNSTLAVTGASTLTGQLNGSTAIFSGNVQAASFTGTMTIGGGSGVTFSGVIPIANGGTGQSSAANALSALFSGAGTISQMIPGADIVNNSITSTQLNTTGVTAGTYSSVTVGADGRVTSGMGSAGTSSAVTDGSGESITLGTSGGIVYTIGSSVQGNWTTTGLMVGSSKTALDKLDVYGGVAIGSSYAGSVAAPTNGLIVQGQVAIGTSIPNGALNVNGTISATAFVGSGAGLTSIGTGAISGTLATSNGGTGTSTTFTQGSVVYAGPSGIYNQDNANFFYDSTHHWLGLGTATPLANLTVNGTTAFMLGADYTITGSQADVSLGSASTVRYNGSAVATFYGIQAGVNGQVIHLHNASNYILTLSNLSSSEATAANQIITGTSSDMTIQSNSSVILQYDTAAAKWRVIGGPGGGPGLTGQVAYYQTSGSTAIGTSTIYIVGGNVGIGTATPSSLLHVNGTLHLASVVGGVGASSGASIVGGTTGEVQFNSGGAFTGDTNFYWDNTDKWLGIGTSIPTVPLQVNGAINSVSNNASNPIASLTFGSAYYPVFRGEQARGSLVSPTAVQSGDILANFDGYGYDGTGFDTEAAGIQVLASSTWGASGTRSGYLSFWTTGGGTPGERMRIDSSGNVAIGTTVTNGALIVVGTATATTFSGAHTGNGSGLTGLGTSNLSAVTGTASSTTYLRGDGTWSAAGTVGATTGSGTANYLPLWTGTSTLSNSAIYQSGGNIGIGTTSPANLLDVYVGAWAGMMVRGGTSGTGIGGYILKNDGGYSYEMAMGGSGNGQNFFIYDNTAGANRFTITPTGNVGISTPSPTYPLDVNGSVVVHNSGGISFGGVNGSNNNNQGIWLYEIGNALWGRISRNSSNGNLLIDPQGGANTIIGGTEGGSVGINTTSPGYTLDVNGNINSDSWTYSNELYTRDNVYLGYLGDYISNRLNQAVTSGSSPNFYNPYIGYMGTSLSGWLNQPLLTTSNPTFATPYFNGYVNVNSVNGEGGTIQLAGNNGVTYFIENDNGTLRGLSNGWASAPWTIDQSGNAVFSGTLRSGSVLYVGSATLGTDGNLYMPYLGDYLSNRLNQAVTAGSSPNFYNPYIGYMGTNLSNWINQPLTTGNSPTFGGVVINGTTNSNGRFNLAGNANDWAAVINWGPGSVSNSYGILVGQTNYSQFQNTSGYYAQIANGGWGIYSNGSAYFGGDSYAANYYHTSDRRLKENINPSKGLVLIDKLNGVTFDWKKDHKPSAGVIAQDVETVIPEAVHTDEKGMKSVSYDTLLAPMIEAIKELHALFDKLAEKVAQISMRLDNHDAELESMHEELKALHAEFEEYKKTHP